MHPVRIVYRRISKEANPIEANPIEIREAETIYLSPSQIRVFPNHWLKVA